MDEEEREELIHRLASELGASIGAAFNDEKKFSFIAGARAALVAVDDRLRSHEQRDFDV